MADPRTRYRLVDWLMIVILAALFLTFMRSLGTSMGPGGAGSTTVLIWFGFFFWYLVWNRNRAAVWSRDCAECGQPFSAQARNKGPVPVLCPSCLMSRKHPEQLRREQRNGFRAVIVLLGGFVAFLGYLLSGSTAARFGRANRFALPVIAVAAAFVLILIAVLAVMLVSIARARRFRKESHAFAHADRCARGRGTVVRDGAWTVWYDSDADPTPMLREQAARARARSERLLGTAITAEPPLRIFQFRQRGALASFHRPAIANLWGLDGLYSFGPWRAISFTPEPASWRIHDPGLAIRILFGFYYLEASRGFFPPPWLHLGFGNAIARLDAGDRTRLNRRMIASLARGDAFEGTKFHRIPSRTILSWTRGAHQHDAFRKLAQYLGQSRSWIEYLGGESATEDRRGRFRDFLRSLERGKVRESAWERHFGCGCEALTEGWRAWVLEQGEGEHEPPPPHIRARLIDHVLPTIEDRQGPILKRIQAVRELGQAGYVLGADVLIGLLRGGDPMPKGEIVWALESISGRILGPDPDRWSEWWRGLPEGVARPPIEVDGAAEGDRDGAQSA